jgi:co-chaperonin GroES (HSP10)
MNDSGINPIEFNVLVLQDKIEEKTKGGLLLADDFRDKEKHAQVRGTIVATSPLAFNEDIYPSGMERPKPGDRVAFARHSGAFILGKDGVEYRIVKDKDVVAVIDA